MASIEQKRVKIKGTKAEIKVIEQLHKQKFRDITGPYTTGCYDIKATDQKGKVWLVEVKSGKNPKINMQNFLKMVYDKKCSGIILALVPKKGLNKKQIDIPVFLKIKKQSIGASTTWKNRKDKNSKAVFV